MCVCVRQNWLFRSMTSSGQPRDYQQGHRNRSVHVSAFWASKQTHDSPWLKHKHTHTPGGTIMTPCVCVNWPELRGGTSSVLEKSSVAPAMSTMSSSSSSLGRWRPSKPPLQYPGFSLILNPAESRGARATLTAAAPPSGRPSPEGENVSSTSVGPKIRHSERGNVDV